MNWMFDWIRGLDQGLFHLTNAVWTNPLLDALMPALSWAGNLGAVWLVLLGVIAAFGKKTGRKIVLSGLIALVIGSASSEIIKEITVRPRPFAALPDVNLLVGAPHSYAFPSGHTTSAFAAAGGAALAARRLIGKVPAWGWGMLALAAAMAYSSALRRRALADRRGGGFGPWACKRLGRRPARSPAAQRGHHGEAGARDNAGGLARGSNRGDARSRVRAEVMQR